MYRIIGADGKEYGPISADQMRQWIAEGRLNANTQVLAEGGTEWKPLAQCPEFAGAIPAAPQPQPFATTPSLGGGMGISSAASLVSGPAIGLIATAILGALLQAASLLMNVLGVSMMPPTSMPNEAWAGMFTGTMAIVSSIIGIIVSGLVLFGGLKMKKLESYSLAMVASVVAMIPCISPCCFIGLPIGIWALVVLNKPEVKSAFPQ